MIDDPKTLIAGYLGGPTASGKSSLGVAIARRHDLAIVSADSMQVYRGMEIGTGAIPEIDRRGVSHHLLSIVDPSEDFHAARFVDAALRAISSEFAASGRKSLVVGGTGMWIQALREGLFDGPGRDESIRKRLRKILEAKGPEALHDRLRKIDPPMADTLSPRDHVRVLRAIEVYELSGRPLSDWHAEDERRRAALGPLPPLRVIDRPREELYARIDKRVDEMLAAGWLNEARRLHALRLPEHSPARKALGYRELYDVIEGKSSIEEAAAEIKTSTRRFAKRQMTWFRGQRGVEWVDGSDSALEMKWDGSLS